jgi:hypothetical protein
MPRKIQPDLNLNARMERVQAFADGQMPRSATKASARQVRMKIGDEVIIPKFTKRALPDQGRAWLTMSERMDPHPGNDKKTIILVKGQIKERDEIKVPQESPEVLKHAADYIGTYYRWNGPLRLEYEMQEPFGIYDTEVYVKQAVNRRMSLMFRNGYEIISEREEHVDYINRRIENCAYVMRETFDSFLKNIIRNLLLSSNCFVLKIRKESAAGVKKAKGTKKEPVAGFSIIPSHTIWPYLKDGEIVKWRRFYETGQPYVDYDVDDIHHFKWDRKTGQIGGTPRTVGVRDDIFALRRLEENIELLFINHLFPLFHVKVGTEAAPATYAMDGSSEADLIKFQIENMPKEGVFVTDERVSVDVVGAKSESLDPKPIIDHYKSRIYIGLGMSALDMGEGADATRATADNISQNLKDAIKEDCENISSQLQMTIFRDWLLEAPYSMSFAGAVASTKLVFHEIDLDNRIKEENHVMALFNNHLITEPEARKRLRYRPIKGTEKPEQMNARNLLHFDLHVVKLVKETEKAKVDGQTKLNEQAHEQAKEIMPLEASHQESLAKTQKGLLKTQAETHERKSAATQATLAAKIEHHKATGGGKGGAPQRATSKKTTQNKKSVQNKNTPTNQHGSNLGPTKAKSSRELFLNGLETDLLSAREQMEADGLTQGEAWKEISSKVVDAALDRVEKQIAEPETEVSDNGSYTKQVRAEVQRLKDMIALTADPEMLAVLVRNGFEGDTDEAGNESAG